ncbi:biotin-dependent carboxyltransferase family protein [soil metagenome]
MVIRVTSVAGLVTVQDLGRPGFMHLGVPRGGALVREAHVRANAAVGNSAAAATFEIFGRLVVSAIDPIRLATDRGDVHELAAGEALVVESGGSRVRYLAVGGGVDVRERLGSRSTLLVAELGGLEGRALRRGDVLAACPSPLHEIESPDEAPLPSPPGQPNVFAVCPGTELGRLDGTFTIRPSSDRVGVRLQGRPVAARAISASVPMVQGAIQVPPDGQPIVLGPDHPTTGGYPVVAFLDDADFSRFFALSPGAQISFRTVD